MTAKGVEFQGIEFQGMRFQGRTILITGGGSGIGRGLAEAFDRLGNQVIIAGRGREKLEATVADNPNMAAMTLDVTDPASIAAFAHEVTHTYPRLDVLINNAGMMRVEDVTKGEVSDAEATIETNLLGPIRLTAALLPHLLKQEVAAVANVTSGLGFVPLPTTPTYCATKAALHSYSQSLREQLKNTSVRVIEIIPPYVQTTLTGDHHAEDPRAMPLDKYIEATMTSLTHDPLAPEVVIDEVAMLRHAEAQGNFEQAFGMLSALGAELAEEVG